MTPPHAEGEQPSTRRLRAVAYLVQPQFMVDDGENLTPLAVQPITIAAVDWANVVEIVATATAELRREVEGVRPQSESGSSG